MQQTKLVLQTDPNAGSANFIITARKPKLREGNVFSHIFPSFCPWEGGSHVTIAHDALDLTIQGPPPSQTCSNLFNLDVTVQGPAHCGQLVQLASGGFASYWNAFLLHLYQRWYNYVTISSKYGFVTGRNEVVAKVIFLHLSVILFTGGVCLRQTPPGQTPRVRHPPGQTPPGQTPPQVRHTPLGADTPLGTKYTPRD